MSGGARLQAVKGMNDLLPPESARWAWFEATAREALRRFGFREIRTPIVEPTELFVRGIGEVTDIVEKEMYSFADALNGDRLTLRPENTAGVVRAAVEHALLHDGPKRLWYVGPMFRHERPQRGRYRQFHQVGVESLGHAGPDADAEVILAARAIFRALGVPAGELRLEINTLGLPDERRAHRAALVAHFEANAARLDDDARRRLHTNPLRILDTKNPSMQALVDAAPRIDGFLGERSRAHFDALQAMLHAAGQPFAVNPRLVRGLDYYAHTVFEWVTPRLGAQGTVCGGGRYDGLVELVGGRPAPGVGWGMGVERVVELLRECGIEPLAETPDAYAVIPDAAAALAAVPVLDALRAAGVAVVAHGATAEGFAGMKAQFRRADASGARFALVFGADELAAGAVALKPLREAGAAQRRFALDAVAEWAAALRPAA